MYCKNVADLYILTELRLNELAVSSKERKDQIYYEPQNFDAIDNVDEKEMVRDQLLKSGKDIIEINESQLDQFAGNMLQVMGDQPYLVMSLTAYNSLSKEQISRLESHNPIIYSNLSTIENYGGGSARCMMAEIFLPTKKEI